MKSSVKAITVTPEMASSIIRNELYERQRPVNHRMVRRIAETIKRGEFPPMTQIVFATINGGGRRLIDGQHRLMGVIMAGCSIMVTSTTVDFPSSNDMYSFYAGIDQGMKRSTFDGALAFGAFDSYDEEIPSSYLKKVSMATKCIDNKSNIVGVEWEVIPPKEITDRCIHYREEAQIYFNIHKQSDMLVKRHFKTPTYMAIGLILLKQEPERGLEFLEEVAFMSGTVGSPSKKFVASIINPPAISIPKRVYQIRAISRYWNAFFKGRKLKQLKYTYGNFELYGTSFRVK